MNGGEDIGVGVDPVKLCHHMGEEAAALYLGAQILAIGDQQPDCHAEEEGQRQITHVAPVGGIVPKEQVESQTDEQGIPQAVGDQGIFTEWDIVVYRQLRGQ